MRGYPKHLNTKADYEFVKNDPYCKQFAADLKAEQQRLLDSRLVWETTKELAKEADGTTDATHRVIAETDEEGNTKYIQQAKIEDPKAKMFRLGLTKIELESSLSAQAAEGSYILTGE